jgi:MarR family transcriptional regulator, organic hydroperoxide resistance regulator
MSAGQTLFEFVRFWSRRGAALRDPSLRGRDVLVTETVHALRGLSEVTVNDVAAELGLDQSGASRMVTHAVDEGYLAVHPSPSDARRRTVTVTAAGTRLLADAHRWQEEVFASLTADWTAPERAAFEQAMLRLLSRSRQQ